MKVHQLANSVQQEHTLNLEHQLVQNVLKVNIQRLEVQHVHLVVREHIQLEVHQVVLHVTVFVVHAITQMENVQVAKKDIIYQMDNV